MLAALTFILLFLYFATSSTVLIGMFVLSVLGSLATGVHRHRMESQNKERVKVEQEQLDILKRLAVKEGIELPESPPPKESVSIAKKSFLAGDEGKDLRAQLRGRKQ